jgi:hypothetical protein
MTKSEDQELPTIPEDACRRAWRLEDGDVTAVFIRKWIAARLVKSSRS